MNLRQSDGLTEYDGEVSSRPIADAAGEVNDVRMSDDAQFFCHDPASSASFAINQNRSVFWQGFQRLKTVVPIVGNVGGSFEVPSVPFFIRTHVEQDGIWKRFLKGIQLED